MKVIQVKNGQPVVTENGQLYAKCCGCGLAHLFKITKVGREFALIAYRDDYLTDLGKHSKRPKDRPKRRS